MGREASCRCESQGRSGTGTLLLETKELLFRGTFKLKIRLEEITSVEAEEGQLSVRFGQESVTFHLSTAAGPWARAILQPKGLVEKLGIKAQQRVMVIGLDDPDFLVLLAEREATIVKRGLEDLDHLFFAVATPGDLDRIPALKKALKPNGALWILRPKGPASPVHENVSRAAGRSAGMVDVKVVGFSASFSAEKYVIPLSDR